MEAREDHEGTLRAGAVKRTITPTIRGRHVFIAGGEKGRAATDIHDELWVRAVAVGHGQTVLVFMALDLIGLSREHVLYVRDQAADQGLPGDNVIVACTHNYAGPDLTGQWSKGRLGSGLNLRYVQFLRRELVEVARLAVEAMQPAQAYVARGQVQDLVGDDASRELAVLQFRTPAGQVIATLLNFMLVPRVLDDQNTIISADFCHWLYEEMESGPDAVTLYTCAEAGDRGDLPFRERSFAEAERIGRGLAAAVRELLPDAAAVEVDRLGVWRQTLASPSSEAVARWLRQAGVFPQDGTDWFAESEVGLIQLGPARLALLPGLPDPQLGAQIRKMLDTPYRFVLGLSNDDMAYIPPQESPGAASESRSDLPTRVLDGLDQLLLKAHAAFPDPTVTT